MVKAKNVTKYSLSELKGKSVLITGGLGFIGSNLAHKCLELGAKVTIYDCLDSFSGGNLYNIDYIKNSVELVFSSILNFDDVLRHIIGKDIVFNCAASTSHPYSMREPWGNLDVNCTGVINLLEAARRANRDIKFVHIGTSTQLGKLHFKPADETHPEFPVDIYSANKTVSEKYVLIYGSTYNMPVTVIRLSNVFGPKASIHSSDFAFVNYFIGLALQNKKITVFGNGTQLRNIIYIDDCVDALIVAAQNQKVNNEVFFAAGDVHYSVAEIAKMTVKYIGSGSVKFVSWPEDRRLIEIGDAVISNAKIRKILNWGPKIGLDDGLVKTRKYYEGCLRHYLK